LDLLFPALPIVQLMNNSLRVISELLTGTAGGVPYFLSAACGKYVFEAPQSQGQNSLRARLMQVPFQALSSKVGRYLDGK